MSATTLRLAQIAEALEWLEEVFCDPTGVGDCSIEDAAVSLASEFVAGWSDEEVVARLTKLVEAESAGSPKDAARHLKFVERKVRGRWSEQGVRNAAKALVAEPGIAETWPGVAWGVSS